MRRPTTSTDDVRVSGGLRVARPLTMDSKQSRTGATGPETLERRRP
jgi:hypothetical protein